MIEFLAFVAPFPDKGPYRVDQVRTDPVLLSLLYFIQLCLAFWIFKRQQDDRGRQRFIVPGVLLFAIGTFFALSSWGLGDVTKLSYALVEHPHLYGWREPLWTLIAPLVRYLPYRFSFIHGFVAASYAAAAIWLAFRQESARWGGWWALMIVYSPLLRGYLQSGVTRQAFAVLLLMPIMLYVAGVVRFPKLRGSVLVFFAGIAHSTFFLLLLVALAPLVANIDKFCKIARHWLSKSNASSARGYAFGFLFFWLVVCVFWALMSFDHIASKLIDYAWVQEYYPQYILRPEVGLLLGSMAFTCLCVLLVRRISIGQFLSSRLARSMVIFSILLLLIRFSIEYSVFPQLSWRFQDAVSFYLIITYLVWMSRQMMQRLTLVPFLLTMQYWAFDRLGSAWKLPCGSNDEFLCIPDRLPWDVTYWG